MKNMWCCLILSVASLPALAPSLHAQAVYTADRKTRIQVGGGALILNSDYTAGNVIGFSAWGDYDFSKWVGVEVSAHLGEFITPGDITENSYLIGPRLTYRRRKLTAYGKVLIGRATITNQDYNLSSSYNIFAYGGGVEYKIMRKINIRAIDFELQSWPDFQPNSLSPMAITIGASYIIH
jgi:hypothetical protein